MKKHTGFILLSAAFGLVSANASVDCIALSLSVKNSSAADRSSVLELVSREVAAAPGCACEIVKAAIEGSAADSKTVAAIVQSAATAAPEQMRLISQCAVAVAPDSLTEVQGVIALLDPNLGESANAKSSKDSKAPAGEVAAMPNPLDFPGQGPVGPTPGGPGGAPLIGPGRSSILPSGPPINVVPPVVIRPPGKPPVVPPVINPPPVTSVDQPPVVQPPVDTAIKNDIPVS
jgi:hypothetical protein